MYEKNGVVRAAVRWWGGFVSRGSSDMGDGMNGLRL